MNSRPSTPLKLMCILAHPDDESLGTGGILAKYSSEGIETSIVCATRGEKGRFGDAAERPAATIVGKTREDELRCAAAALGVKYVSFLDYVDGELDQANPQQAIAKIVAQIRKIRPHVVATFGPDGGYGHPDHIAISQFTTAASICAADASYESEKPLAENLAHRIDKLYYMAWTPGKWAAYTEAFRDLKITVDGCERRATPWPEWEVTTVVNTEQYWERVWRAVNCHKTQLTIYSKLRSLSSENHRALWGTQEFYRVFSTVNGGRKRETDLFEGLR